MLSGAVYFCAVVLLRDGLMARLVLALFAIATVVACFSLYALGFLRRLSGRAQGVRRNHRTATGPTRPEHITRAAPDA